MIIGMRGLDLRQMQPEDLAIAIKNAGFDAVQLVFTKAFPQPTASYMTPNALRRMRKDFDRLYVMREGVWPNHAQQESTLMRKWLEDADR